MRLIGLNDIGINIATNRNDYVAIGIYDSQLLHI